MRIVKNVLIGLTITILLLLGIGLLLPSHFSIERSIVIHAPAEKIFALIDRPSAWPSWTIWNRRDPKMIIHYSGPASGAGASWRWQSATEGNGEMRFTAVEPNKVVHYQLFFADFGMTSTGVLRLDPADGAMRVTWTNEGEMGNSPVNRYFGLFMDRMVGPDYEGGLSNLKALAEHKP